MGWNYRSHVPSIRSELLELRVEGGFSLHYLPISRSGIFRFVHVHVFLLDFPISADSDRQLSGNGQSDAQFSSQSFGLAVSGNCQTDSKFAGQDRRTDDIQHICTWVGSLWSNFILVPCRLKYPPRGGGCNIVENILVPCRLKYTLGGGWVSKA